MNVEFSLLYAAYKSVISIDFQQNKASATVSEITTIIRKRMAFSALSLLLYFPATVHSYINSQPVPVCAEKLSSCEIMEYAVPLLLRQFHPIFLFLSLGQFLSPDKVIPTTQF
jgi:hypothetical protein